MLSLKTLRLKTPEDVIHRSRKTNAWMEDVQITKNKALKTIVFKGKGQAFTEEKQYDLTVELYPVELRKDIFEAPGEDNPAWVSCSCPYFKYYCQQALAKVGSSSLDAVGDNADPMLRSKDRNVQKNPGLIPYLCKHLYKVVPDVIELAEEIAEKKDQYTFIKRGQKLPPKEPLKKPEPKIPAKPNQPQTPEKTGAKKPAVFGKTEPTKPGAPVDKRAAATKSVYGKFK